MEKRKKESMLKLKRAIQDYIQEYGEEVFVDNIKWQVSDRGMTLSYQIYITESNPARSDSDEDLLCAWSGKNIY